MSLRDNALLRSATAATRRSTPTGVVVELMTKKTLLLVIAFALCVPDGGRSQTAPPSTDIFIVEVERGLKLGAPRNITQRDGYDNQPEFINGGKTLLYTSIREDGQADIYSYELDQRTTARLTNTSESEYSPTLTPDGKYFSVIRVEADKSQRLWKFPLGGGAPVLVLEAIKPVGYHLWLNQQSLLVFILGRPNTLQIVDTRTQKAEVLASDVGRCFRHIPGGRLISFVHKVSNQEWWLKSLDAQTHEVKPLIKTLPGSEDYVWLTDGSALMGKDSKLFKWKPGESDWQEAADLSRSGLKSITRMAISPKGDRLAIVAEPGPSR